VMYMQWQRVRNAHAALSMRSNEDHGGHA